MRGAALTALRNQLLYALRRYGSLNLAGVVMELKIRSADVAKVTNFKWFELTDAGFFRLSTEGQKEIVE